MQRRSFLGGIFAALTGFVAGKVTPEAKPLKVKAVYKLHPVGQDWNGEVKPLIQINEAELTEKLKVALEPVFEKLLADFQRIADAKIKGV